MATKDKSDSVIQANNRPREIPANIYANKLESGNPLETISVNRNLRFTIPQNCKAILL